MKKLPCLCGAIAAFTAIVAEAQGVIDPDPIVAQSRIIADTSTAIPSASGTFAAFDTPATDGNNIVFGGSRAGLAGVYRWDGGQLRRVADTTQAVPGTAQLFTQFWSSDVEAGEVVFTASANGGLGGVYRFAAGTLQALTDGATPLPGQSGAQGLFFVSAEGNLVVASKPSPPSAVYRVAPGPIETIALDGDPIPGGGVFEMVAVAPHRTNGVATAFMAGRAGTAWPRVVLSQGGALTLIAEPGTAVPDGTIAELDYFSTPLIVGTQVYFAAKPATKPYRLYRWDNGVITIAAQGVAISAPSGLVALGFLENGAFVSEREGRVLVETTGQFAELLGPFSAIGQRAVDDFECGPESVAANSVVCSVMFTDGSAGIVSFDVQLPSAGGGGGGGGGSVGPAELLLIALVAVASRGWRRASLRRRVDS